MLSAWLKSLFKLNTDMQPAKAYDLWATRYDGQPGNLMLDLDEKLFNKFLSTTELNSKVVVDIGCGTGRHWEKILAKEPERLIGYDVSEKMLEKLRNKFPDAEVYLSNGNRYAELKSLSVDLLISTLTIAHIENIEEAFAEWTRILKPGGEIILTDFHPDALAKGARRTFSIDGKTVAIKNFIHPLSKIKHLASRSGLKELSCYEKVIGDSMRAYYANQNALDVFERFKNTPIIYGIHLKKNYDPE